MSTYAEAVKRSPEENLEGNIISHQQQTHQQTTSTFQNNEDENYNATLFGQDTVNENKKIVEDMKKIVVDRDEKRRVAKRGGSETSKCSKGVLFFTVAVDIALA